MPIAIFLTCILGVIGLENQFSVFLSGRFTHILPEGVFALHLFSR